MPPLLRRLIVPIIFATIFIVIPFLVITLATDEQPIVREEDATSRP